MKIKLLVIGKTSGSWLNEGIDIYVKRLLHYTDFNIEVVPDIKNPASLSESQLKEMESSQFMKKIDDRDWVVLLDENGKQFTSEAFAGVLEKWMVGGTQKVVFIIGGAFGFGSDLVNRANMKIALSEMTFSHQMVRLIFVEQLYRGFTIIRNESYHHK